MTENQNDTSGEPVGDPAAETAPTPVPEAASGATPEATTEATTPRRPSDAGRCRPPAEQPLPLPSCPTRPRWA